MTDWMTGGDKVILVNYFKWRGWRRGGADLRTEVPHPATTTHYTSHYLTGTHSFPLSPVAGCGVGTHSLTCGLTPRNNTWVEKKWMKYHPLARHSLHWGHNVPSASSQKTGSCRPQQNTLYIFYSPT